LCPNNPTAAIAGDVGEHDEIRMRVSDVTKGDLATIAIAPETESDPSREFREAINRNFGRTPEWS